MRPRAIAIVLVLISTFAACTVAELKPAPTPSSRPTTAKVDPAATSAAIGFFHAYSTADFATLGKLYAEKVTLKPTSDMRNEAWGLRPKGYSVGEPLTVDRDKLLAALKAKVEETSKNKWTASLYKTPKERIRVTVSAPGEVTLDVDLNDYSDKGHIFLLQLDKRLLFFLQKNDKGQWQVVAELTTKDVR